MTLKKSDPQTKEAVIESLKNGNVVIIPTDTVYGFSGIVPQADKAIREIKGRSETKPFIQLIGKPEDIRSYTDDVIPPELLSYWPGPLTIIVNNKKEQTTTAFRCPGDPWLREIIDACGAPVYSSSVNRSGSPLLTALSDMESEFGNEVSVIVDGGETPENALPSTIVSVAGGTVSVIRQGAIQL